jgi:hypothetical protein
MSLEELLKEINITLEEYEAGVLSPELSCKVLYEMLVTTYNVLHSIGVE